MTEKKYDIIIIGSGPGGHTAALHAAGLGMKALMIEKSETGGTCLNRGCIPTKALIASAVVLRTIATAKNFGIGVNAYDYDFLKISQRKDGIVKQLSSGLQSLLKSWGVESIKGIAAFIDNKKIEIISDDGIIHAVADKIIIATGSIPANVRGIETDGRKILNSDHVLQLKELPAEILIIGGGVIGVEFASIFNTFGVKVTMVEMLPEILPAGDAEVARNLRQILEKEGITVKTGTMVDSVSEASGKMKTVIKSGEKKEEIITETVLVATGRFPFTGGLGLEKAGITTVKGYIKTNENMETNSQGIYAIGDVTGNMMLAHVAAEEGIVASENAAGNKTAIDYSIIPSCVYSIPQVASVGLTETKAKEAGINYKIGKFPFVASSKAHLLDRKAGFVKIIAEMKTGRLLGVHIIGEEATELIAEGAMALKMGATEKSFTRIIHAHPTLYETMLEAVDDLDKKSIMMMRKKSEI